MAPPAEQAGEMSIEVFSASTAAAWVTALVGISTLFAVNFLLRGKTAAVAEGDRRKREKYTELMAVVRQDVEAKEAAAKAEDKEEAEDLPEAERIFELLWDDVKEAPTTSYGIPPENEDVKFMESLLRRFLAKELADDVEKTREATSKPIAELENGEYFSGEKLKEKIEFCEQVQKSLGKSFVDAEKLKEARDVVRLMASVQRKNLKSLLQLMYPILPLLLVAVPAQMIAEGLQSIYYMVARWALVGEAAARGEDDVAVWHLIDLALGHLAIWFFEFITRTYSMRAQMTFLKNLRTGVMRALLQQDFEYFDKNPAGALQERLNRDAEKLGGNIIELPRDILGKVTCISLATYQVASVCPRKMFILAMLPLPLAAFMQHKLQKVIGSFDSRGRKLAEEAASSTAEVLKEIRTVRQFATERRETTRFGHAELMRAEVTETAAVITGAFDYLFGVVIVSGMIFTIYLGVGQVKAGQMSPSVLFDISIKLNHWVVFRIMDLIRLSPQVRLALEPLGRLCQLLQSAPKIEESGRLRPLEVASAAELDAVMAKCETAASADGDKRGLECEQTVLCEVLALGDGGPPLPKGTVLMAVEFGGGIAYRAVFGKKWLMEQNLAFPLTLLFSPKKVPARFKGAIEFDNVHFRYPTDLRKSVLDGLSFNIEPGRKIALVGEAGCGKSSTMGLLTRLYDPVEGAIRIDGIDLRELNVHHLRSRVVIVDQKPVLFAASVRDNITYGLNRDVPDEEVISALRDASLWEGENGIKGKPDQILTRLGSGGISLSGGQTQRVSIARVMIRNPDVILLDEATSALDNKNEKIVQKALDKLARKGSALVIAHRLTTIKDADRIVVMRQGRVAEQGTHEELLKISIVREQNDQGEQDVVAGIYRFLWELQFHVEDVEEVPLITDALRQISSTVTPAQPEGEENGEPEVPAKTPSAWLKVRKAKGKLLAASSVRALFDIVRDTPCVTPTGKPAPLDLLRASTA
uniref:ABC transporter n=1 Tax=Alexandrium monilatum TaxID=311494 RepID=A0A7S4QJ93_9DINO|mmetsp:Transcript_92727/g.276551  ORF Transcript_92727/g.276551 Transcript_92727/m.276551 type:complete len:981 (-) Transcript_92727:8-2950(-)